VRFPWSFVAAIVLLLAGIGLVVPGAVVPEADRLLDVGVPCISAAISMFAGKGIDAYQSSKDPD